MSQSIFGIASPKFKDLDTNQFVNFRCRILKDEQDYKEIMHQSIIDAHREWNDIPEHWIYECEIFLLKYPEEDRKDFYLLLDSYENKIVEFYRRSDGAAWGNFRVDEVTPYYLDHPDYPDKIFMRFISVEGIDSNEVGDDTITVSVNATDDEAQYPSNTGTFRISRAGGSNNGNLIVPFTISGTATAGIDYEDDLGTQAIIPDGQSYIDVIATPLNSSPGSNLSIIMTLDENPDYYNLGTNTDTITILAEAGEILVSGKVFEYDYVTSNPVGIPGTYVKMAVYKNDVPPFGEVVYADVEIGNDGTFSFTLPETGVDYYFVVTNKDGNILKPYASDPFNFYTDVEGTFADQDVEAWRVPIVTLTGGYAYVSGGVLNYNFTSGAVLAQIIILLGHKNNESDKFELHKTYNPSTNYHLITNTAGYPVAEGLNAGTIQVWDIDGSTTDWYIGLLAGNSFFPPVSNEIGQNQDFQRAIRLVWADGQTDYLQMITDFVNEGWPDNPDYHDGDPFWDMVRCLWKSCTIHFATKETTVIGEFSAMADVGYFGGTSPHYSYDDFLFWWNGDLNL